MKTLAWFQDGAPVRAAAVVSIVAGIVGSLVGPDWLILFTGVGLFGPLLLRESGLIRWRDEFQRETTYRACMHALVAVGVLIIGTMATQGFGGLRDPKDMIAASTVLWVLGLTWGLSRVLQFWGAAAGAFRLLLGGCAVLLVIATTRLVVFGTDSIIKLKNGPPSTSQWVLAITWLLALTLLIRLRPKYSGWLLILTAVASEPMLCGWSAYLGSPTQGWTNTVGVWPVVGLPILAIGLSLISVRGERAGRDIG